MAQGRSARIDGAQGLSRTAKAATVLYLAVCLVAMAMAWTSGAAGRRAEAVPPARINARGEAAPASPADGVDRPLRAWPVEIAGRGATVAYAADAAEAAGAGRRWSASHPVPDAFADGMRGALPVAIWAAVLYGLLWLVLRSALWIAAGAAPARVETPAP